MSHVLQIARSCKLAADANRDVGRSATADELKEASETIVALESVLRNLVNAKALAGVRAQVAGWNGEGKPDGPYDRLPPRLGATVPKTNCGAVYELDEAMCAARALLGGAS